MRSSRLVSFGQAFRAVRSPCRINNVFQSGSILTDKIYEARTRSELVTAPVGLEVVRRAARVDLVEHGPDVGQGNLVTGLEESEDSGEVAGLGGDEI